MQRTFDQFYSGKWFIRSLETAFTLAFLAVFSSSFAQNISGIINSYAKVIVVDTCHNSLLVDNVTDFKVGDRVLLMQMKGAVINASNTNSFGVITDMANAGGYEFTMISSIKGIQVFLRDKITRLYDVSSSVQLIRVPQYNDITVVDTLRAKIWDGSIGGVLVFEATGTTHLQGTIDVSGQGFRGGDSSSNKTGADSISYRFPKGGDGGEKGEAVAQYILKAEAGRGPQANGGGGGNNQNSGGGGGANGGSGGKGGLQTSAFTQLDNGGLGGLAIDYISNTPRLFMGGGGGGGQENDSYGTPGGRGGGLVIIRTDSLDGQNRPILSNGASARKAGDDGAGGGGGAGTIAIYADSILSPIILIAKGGNGGDNDALKISSQDWCYAPGGGGGGGRIYVSGSITPIADVSAGSAGKVIFDQLSCYGTTYGATDGSSGVINNGFVPFDSPIPFTYPIAINRLDSICGGDSVVIGINGGQNFSWKPTTGLDNPTVRTPIAFPSTTTKYIATYEDLRGCVFSDTILVIVNPTPTTTIQGPSSLCAQSVAKYYIAPQSGIVTSWNVEDGTIINQNSSDTITVQWGLNSTGAIHLSLIPVSGHCPGAVDLAVTLITATPPLILGAHSTCEGDSVELTASAGFSSYLWSTGDTTQSITVGSSGNYFVLGAIVGGCVLSSDTIDFIVHPKLLPVISAWVPALPDSGGFDTLIVGGRYSKYLWSTGQQSDTLVILDSGTYSVTVTDSNGCVGIASIYIPRDLTTPFVIVGTDTIIANPGDHINFPVRLIDSRNLPPSGCTEWVTTFTFNRTLMAPEDRSLPSNTIDRLRTVSISGNRPDPLERGIMRSVPFIATLGDATETPVLVETFGFTNGRPTVVSKVNGLLRIVVCDAGGARLFSDKGELILGQNHPNPASKTTTIDISLREEGHTALVVCDMLGRTVKTIIDGDYKIGELSFDIDIADLPIGKYIYVLKTPSAVRTNILQIDR